MFKSILLVIALIAGCAAQAKPNIVLIVVDDFSMNLLPAPNDGIGRTMPNLARMMREGMVFNNYFVSNSLCCPSRASIFTGLLPHNSGVLTNTPPNGGYSAFMQNGNEAKTFAPVLQSQGYKTSFMGKYLNGYKESQHLIPFGWNDWAVTSTGYQGYGYTLNHNYVMSTPPDHITDAISQLGVAFLAATPAPVFLELAPFSPHSPFVPPTRYDGLFLGAVMPKTPAFAARPDAAAPEWLQIIPPLRSAAKSAIKQAFILRLQSSKGIDDMIGAVRNTLRNLGLADNTYVIFTSDNGYHMGEFSLRRGKATPFDFDIKVPFIIVGPGIAPGSTNNSIAMNIDLAPTFAELAGAPPSTFVDGRSMVPLFAGGTSSRTMAVIEHVQRPFDPNDPDATGLLAGNPPTYVALRMATALYVEYLDGTGVVGYYDMTTDPHQLHNIAASLTPGQLATLHSAAAANYTCAGAAQCGAAQNR